MGDHLCQILTTPQKILGSLETGVALMAVSATGRDLTIDMRLPGVRRVLERLASDGVGMDAENQGVRFMFVELAHGAMGVSMGLDDLD